jgi:hypothetical protein
VRLKCSALEPAHQRCLSTLQPTHFTKRLGCALQGPQRDAVVARIGQAVELGARRLDPGGHCCLGEPLAFHRAGDLRDCIPANRIPDQLAIVIELILRVGRMP